MTEQEAHEYIRAHDQAVKDWNRKSKAALIGMIEMTERQGWVIGGPRQWSKDECINWLAERFYPSVQAARDVYYATVTR